MRMFARKTNVSWSLICTELSQEPVAHEIDASLPENLYRSKGGFMKAFLIVCLAVVLIMASSGFAMLTSHSVGDSLVQTVKDTTVKYGKKGYSKSKHGAKTGWRKSKHGSKKGWHTSKRKTKHIFHKTKKKLY